MSFGTKRCCQMSQLKFSQFAQLQSRTNFLIATAVTFFLFSQQNCWKKLHWLFPWPSPHNLWSHLQLKTSSSEKWYFSMNCSISLSVLLFQMRSFASTTHRCHRCRRYYVIQLILCNFEWEKRRRKEEMNEVVEKFFLLNRQIIHAHLSVTSWVFWV